jgi:ribosomal RNA-processing protein 9
MSSFFTTPASQRKRKREDVNSAGPGKRQNTNVRATSRAKKSELANKVRDESISGSGSEDDIKGQKPGEEESEISNESDEEDETGAERRLRLAEKYLENIKGKVDDIGYDAEEIDRDLIAERLHEDVVCTCELPRSSPEL